jgi:protein involved in polysaccharide export with SLBB domain
MIQPLDHVNIPKTDVTAGVAAADGWLNYPGQYPIEVGVTTLTDLIAMAGGFRQEALVRGAYLERNAAFGEKASFVDPSTPTTGRYEVISDTSSALLKMRLGDLDFLSRQFLARWIKMDRRVSVDVLAATRPGAEPVYLRNGDRLVVPQDEHSVFVIGEVMRPGRVAVEEDAEAETYVAAAGGRGPFAAGTYVIHAGTGALQSSSAPVYSGDYIFVNRDGGEVSSYEAERLRIMDTDQSVRNRQVWLQAVTAAAAVVTTTILVIRELGN